MNYTSVEQSKKLVELGLDPCTADMTWGEETSDLTKKFEWKVSAGLNVAIKDNLFSYRKGYVLPCWSVGALLEVMPKHPKFNTAIRIIEGKDIIWAFECHAISEYEFKGTSDLECLYNAVVWLLENNYIKQ